MPAEQFGEITASVDGSHVATVEFHRPPSNYFDAPLLESMVAAMRWSATNAARAVVLCSEGKHFCAGADFSSPAFKGQKGFDSSLYDRAAELFETPLPIVAAVQGAAVGGGLGLAMAADFRVAASNARFTANFSRLGFHHGFALSVTLPDVIGPQAARTLLYTGRWVDATEAERIGLCDQVAPEECLREQAHALAAELASAAPLAVQAIRQTMRRHLVEAVAPAMARELEEATRLISTEDFKEGIRAARRRRSPEFAGR